MLVLVAERSLNANYRNALEKLALPYRVSLESDGTEDALLIPGGGDVNPCRYGEEMNGSEPPDDELDEKQIALCRAFAEKRKPVLGICRGCQVLNVALGGSLIQDLLLAERHKAIPNVGDRFHEVTSREDSLMRRMYGVHFQVNSAHHQACKKPGEGLIPTLFAEDGTIEAIEHESLPVIGVQFHPERLMREGLPPRTVDGTPIFAYLKSLLAD